MSWISFPINGVHPLTFNSLPLKHDDWKTIYILLKNALFSGATLNFGGVPSKLLGISMSESEVKSVFRDILAEEAHNKSVSSDPSRSWGICSTNMSFIAFHRSVFEGVQQNIH